MIKYILPLLFVVLSGCTHLTISNPELLVTDETRTQPLNSELELFPLNLDADMDCSKSQSGNTITTRCSNEARIKTVVMIFNERGLQAVPPAEEEEANTPILSVKKKEINRFLEQTTGFFNLITLGVIPLYHYDDYIVSYQDPALDINVTEEVRINFTMSWFSLFMTTPPELKGRAGEYLVEQNLIRSVLDDANVGK